MKTDIQLRHIAKGINPEAMTYDQKVATVAALDGLIDCCCGCAITKAGEGTELPFENALVELLLVKWGTATKKSVEEASKRLNNGKGPISKAEKEAVLKIFEYGLMTRFANDVGNGVGKYVKGSYVKGKSDVFKQFKEKQVFDKIDDVTIEWLTKHNLYWVENYYDRFLSQSIAEQVAKGIKDGLGRDQIGKDLKKFFDGYEGIPQKPQSYWTVVSSNAMSRSRNFSRVQAYVDLEYETLKIVNPNDNRTSPICRKLNGTTIPVISAVKQRDGMIRAKKPEDVKNLAPWVPYEKMKTMNLDKRLKAGIILPPYHALCRTQIVGHK